MGIDLSAAAPHLVAAAAAPRALWYATRATGVVALLLLTGTVLLGIAGAGWPRRDQDGTGHGPKRPGGPMTRLVVAGLHRNVPLLAVIFVAVHVLTTVIDGYVPISLVSAFLPFSSPYRTFWLGLGAVASDLLLAVVATSLVRPWLRYRAWRAVHWLAYVCWPVALAHGLGTGTDTRLPWMLLLEAASVLAVATAVVWRLANSRRPRTLAQSAAPARITSGDRS